MQSSAAKGDLGRRVGSRLQSSSCACDQAVYILVDDKTSDNNTHRSAVFWAVFTLRGSDRMARHFPLRTRLLRWARGRYPGTRAAGARGARFLFDDVAAASMDGD